MSCHGRDGASDEKTLIPSPFMMGPISCRYGGGQYIDIVIGYIRSDSNCIHAVSAANIIAGIDKRR